jgi:NAD(P)-dependent dehydrogenase (short-subunit alcohol dehydrogenase family)
MTELDLLGRRALVTGGAKGTGAAVAQRPRAAGADVTVTARSMPARCTDPSRFIAADATTRGSHADGGTVLTV